MIYSENINKICSLCRYAEPSAPDSERTWCALCKKEVGKSDPACDKYIYDIFKRPVRRKKRLRTDFSAEDFKL